MKIPFMMISESVQRLLSDGDYLEYVEKTLQILDQLCKVWQLMIVVVIVSGVGFADTFLFCIVHRLWGENLGFKYLMYPID